MAIYLYRNKGGEPRLIHDTNWQIPNGPLISRVSAMSVEERKQADIFEYIEVEPTEAPHRFQTRVVDTLVYDVPLMTATRTFKLADQDLEQCRNLGYTEILAMARGAEEDGFKWTGDVVDVTGQVVGKGGRLQVRDKDKIDAQYVSGALSSGIMPFWNWEVGTNRYIHMGSEDDVRQVITMGFMYQSKIMTVRQVYSTKVREATNVKEVASILTSAMLAFKNIPDRYVSEYKMGM